MDIKILDRKETIAVIILMLLKAKKTVIIISPYITVDDDMLKILKTCTAKNKFIIIRKNSKIDNLKKLKKLGWKIATITNLHAKIYISEDTTIFSSLNLYKYSIENNFELSVLFKTENLKKKEYKKILEIVKYAKEI